MAAKAIAINGRDWFKEPRAPGKKTDHIVTVSPQLVEKLKDCPKVMTVKYLAEMFGVTTWAVYDWIRSGRLQVNRIGNRIRIFREDLAAFLMVESLKK